MVARSRDAARLRGFVLKVAQAALPLGLLEYISRTVPGLAARYGRNMRQVPVSFHRGMDFPMVAP